MTAAEVALIVVLNGWTEDDDTLFLRLESRLGERDDIDLLLERARQTIQTEHDYARAVEAEHDLSLSSEGGNA